MADHNQDVQETYTEIVKVIRRHGIEETYEFDESNLNNTDIEQISFDEFMTTKETVEMAISYLHQKDELTKNNVIDRNSDVSDLQTVDMFVYFPLSQKTTLGNIMLQNEQLKYGTIDEEGNIERYQQNKEYELVEQYENTELDTTITVICIR